MILRASLLQEINKYNSRMLGYLTSMSYNYCQLCVIADPSSMLPITITIDGETKHLEDVAGIVVHTKEDNGDDVTIDVFTKEFSYIAPVMKAIYSVHPEFKTTIENYEDENTHALDEAIKKKLEENPESFSKDEIEEIEMSRKYIQCVMPTVDKNRRDVLKELVKLYHDKCLTDFDTLKAKTLAKMAPLFIGIPKDEIDKAKEGLDESAKNNKEMVERLTEDKYKQIEDAYNEYTKKSTNTKLYNPNSFKL